MSALNDMIMTLATWSLLLHFHIQEQSPTPHFSLGLSSSHWAGSYRGIPDNNSQSYFPASCTKLCSTQLSQDSSDRGSWHTYRAAATSPDCSHLQTDDPSLSLLPDYIKQVIGGHTISQLSTRTTQQTCDKWVSGQSTLSHECIMRSLYALWGATLSVADWKLAWHWGTVTLSGYGVQWHETENYRYCLLSSHTTLENLNS
jgi:hypothetical protein